MDDKERIIKPKPKMTKAERRELQEKQRAAKAATKSSAEKHVVGTLSSSNLKPAFANSLLQAPSTGKISGQVIDLHRSTVTVYNLIPGTPFYFGRFWFRCMHIFINTSVFKHIIYWMIRTELQSQRIQSMLHYSCSSASTSVVGRVVL